MVKIYKQPFAHDGDAIAIPDASQPDGKMSNTDGWTPDYQLPKTDPNYKPVGRQEMNGVFKEVTESLGEIQQFGFSKWQPMQWPQGARVVEGGVVYRAAVPTEQQPPHADWMDDSAVGMGQTWQDVTASRAAGVSYTNTTGRTILVAATAIEDININVTIIGYVGSQQVVQSTVTASGGGGGVASITFAVPPGDIYSCELGAGDTLRSWVELR